MKVNREWPRIVGLHADDSGEIGVVWFAHDTDTGRVYLYDSALFRREVFAVIADRIKGERGRDAWIPVAWEQSAEEVVKRLKDRGCKTLGEGYKDTQVLAEVNSREIWERMRARSFVPGLQNTKWFEESDRFRHVDGGKVPLEGFPLMSATRHAFHFLKKAAKNKPEKRPIQYDARGIV